MGGGLRCWAAASSAARGVRSISCSLPSLLLYSSRSLECSAPGSAGVLCDVAAWTCWPVPFGSACPSRGRCEGGHFYAEPFGNRGDVATVSRVGSRTWGLLLWLPVGLARVSCRRPSVPQK